MKPNQSKPNLNNPIQSEVEKHSIYIYIKQEVNKKIDPFKNYISYEAI